MEPGLYRIILSFVRFLIIIIIIILISVRPYLDADSQVEHTSARAMMSIAITLKDQTSKLLRLN